MSKTSFNMGNVWGRVVEMKDIQEDKRRLNLHLGCMGKFGNVHAFGTLWGNDKIDSFLAQYKKDSGQMFRFKGFFSQYLAANQPFKLTNFRFYQWDVAHNQEPRASFVLRGKVDGTEGKGERGIVNLILSQPAKGKYKATEEKFELWVPETHFLEALKPGEFYEMKGFLQQGDGEDIYGQAKGDVRPYILDVDEF